MIGLGAIPLRVTYGSFIDETIAMVARGRADMVSFAVGAPAPEAIDRAGVADLAEDVLRREGSAALAYGITEGDAELREIIAAEAHADHERTDPREVIVTTGALQAIDLIARVIVRPGDAVVVESPGYTNALSAFRSHQARIVEVPADDDGLDVDRAGRILTGRAFVRACSTSCRTFRTHAERLSPHVDASNSSTSLRASGH